MNSIVDNGAKKILVVEDSPELLTGLTDLLSEKGFTVQVATGGKQALSVIFESNPELILMDVSIPDLDGFEVCKRLKTDQSTADIPVIFMSAVVEDHERAKGFEVGGVDFISKPFVIEELFARIETHLKLRELQQRLEDRVEKQAETIGESEALLRQVANAAFEGIVITRAGKVIDCNENFLETFGYHREDVLGMGVMDFIAPDSKDYVAEQIRSGNNGPYEHLAIRKNGEIFPVEVYGAEVPYFGAQARVTAVRDISEREGWEKTVLRERDRTVQIGNTVPTGIVVENSDYEITFMNDMAREMLRVKEIPIGDLKAGTPWEVYNLDGDPVPRDQQIFQRVLKSKKAVLNRFRIMQWPDGKNIFVSVNAAPLFDGDEVNEVVISLQDISTLLSTEAALRESEERYRSLVESVPVGIYRSTPDGKTLNVNQQLVDILGYPDRQSLLEMNARDLYVNPTVREQFLHELSRKGVAHAFLADFIRYDGEHIHIENYAKLIEDEDGRTTIEGAIMDVTDRKNSEIRHQKLLAAFEHRTILLQTAAEVSKSAAAILSPDELLQKTVDLIQDRFGYYYVGIFLVDGKHQNAILKAGTGKPGKKMIAENHRLAVGGESMIGWCIANSEARIALDVGKEAVRFDNPHLPKTRSEMALPLIAHGEAIGGLSVQSVDEAAFIEEDIAVLQSMADQVAIALQNARLFDTAQREIAERSRAAALLQALNRAALKMERFLTHDQIFKALTVEMRKIGMTCMIFQYDQSQKQLYTRYIGYDSRALKTAEKLVGVTHKEFSIALEEAGIYSDIIKNKETLYITESKEIARQWLPKKGKKFAGKIIDLLKISNVVLAPLAVEEQIIGVLSVQGEELYEEDQPAITAFANLVAASWSKADLFEQAQQEIAARKEAEKQLQLQASALQAAANGIVITDNDGSILWANPAFSELTGYSVEEVLGKGLSFLKSGTHDDSFYKNLWRTILAGDVWHGEMINRHKDGRLFTEDMTITPVKNAQGDITNFIAIKRDITNRKLAERALQESEEKFAKAFRSSPFPIIITSMRDERIVEVNEGFSKVTGFRREEAVDRTLGALNFWVERKDAWRFRREFLKSKGVLRDFEFNFRMKYGELRLFRLSVEQVNIADEDCALTVAEDITERKLAQEQLRIQAAALNAAANGIMISKLDDEIIWANPAMENLTGYSLDEIIGQSPDIFSSYEHDEGFYESIRKTLNEKLVWQGEMINRRKDGSHYFEEQTIAPVVDANGDVTHHVAIKYDITARKIAEQETQRRVQQLGAIISMGQAVTSSLKLNEVLDEVIGEVPALVGAEGRSILLLDGDELVFVATSGADAERLRGLRMPASQGIAGQVIESRQSILVNEDFEQDEIYRDIEESDGYKTRSVMAVPLIIADEIIGVIEAVHSELRAFDMDDLFLFETVANWASIAIGNARHHETTQRRLQESEAFVNISRALSSTLETEKTLRLIVDSAQQVIPNAEKAVIHLLDDSNQVLIPEAVAGIREKDHPEFTMRSGEGVAGRVIAEGKAINIGDIQSDSRYIARQEIEYVQSLLVVPVQISERIMGTISVQSSGKNAFSQDDMRLLTILGLQAGLAIETAQQHENIQRRFQESQTLAIISQALTETLELDEVLQLIGESVRQIIPSAERTVIHLLDDEKQALWPTVAIGLDEIDQPKFNIHVGEGIAGRVVAEGTTMNIGDVQSENRYLKLGGATHLHSLMVAPVQSGHRRYGTISIQSANVEAFSVEDERLLTILGFQAALAIKNARLFDAERSARERAEVHAEELRIREQNLSIINEITQAALERHSFKHAMEIIVEKLAKLMLADACYIAQWDEAKNQSYPIAAFGPLKDDYAAFTLKPDQLTLTESALRKEKVLYISDAKNSPHCHASVAKLFPTRTALALPLIVGDQKLGAVIIAYHELREISLEQVAWAEYAAGQIALAIAKAHLLEQTNQRAEELAILHASALAGTEASNEDALLEMITEIGKLHFVDNFGFMMVDDEAGWIRSHHSYHTQNPMDIPIGKGIIGRTIASKSPQRVADVFKDSDYIEGEPETRSELCVPIIVGDKAIGAINVESVEYDAFRQADERLLMTMAGQVATALQRLRLFENVNQRLNEVNALYQISQNVVANIDVSPTLKQVTDLLQQDFGYYHVHIYLFDSESHDLIMQQGSGLIGSELKRLSHSLQLDTGIVGHVASSGKTFMSNNVAEVPFYLENPLLLETTAELAVPLIARGEIFGVLDIQHRSPNKFSENDLRMATTVADQIALALDKEQLYIDLQESLKKEKNTRARLIQTEKLAAMGRLVASVAHELNNPLQAIQNALYLIQVEDTLSDQSQDDLKVALGETDRMAGLIARLRETYRPRGEADFTVESLNDLIDEVHKLIATHLRHNNVSYRFEPDPNLPEFPMIRDQIKQVILNLGINAIESMPEGGEIEISTHLLEEYSLARLLISDNGPGIDPAILPNIFEPFFTTKKKGTGLGLAVSYEIVQVHGGKIFVSNENDSGCTFEILLPLERV